MLPVLVKGDLEFNAPPDQTGKEEPLRFDNQNISLSGTAGLPWALPHDFNPIGKTVQVHVAVTTGDGFSFHTPAKVIREYTPYASHLGLRFQLPSNISERLATHIQREGFFPTEYIRKYPRIPSFPMIQTFPLRALAFHASTPHEPGKPSLPFSFDVENLSPNGVLMVTENQAALAINPGDKMTIVLEPRGWFPMPIQLEGQVCRITDEINEKSGNLSRHLGIKFTRLDELNRSAFVDLLKDILERFKKL